MEYIPKEVFNMTNNKNVFSQGAKQNKSTPTEDINTRAARYNYIKMQKDTQSAKEGFAERLASLRSQKGESAREMSLSLGQGPGYISNIENGYSWPSVEMLFEICEYLNITPAEFFSYTTRHPAPSKPLAAIIDQLNREERELITQIIEKLTERKK